MRVSGGSGGGSGWQGSTGSRSASFRRAHRVGQVVRGVVLRPETGETGLALFAWLRVDSHELLADVGRTVEPGEAMLLRIDALEPDIVLRELRGGEHGGGPSLAQIVPTFRAERDRFEALLSGAAGWPESVLAAHNLRAPSGLEDSGQEPAEALPSPPPTRQEPLPPGPPMVEANPFAVDRRERFNAFLAGDSELMEAYLRVLGQELALDACLRDGSSPGSGRGQGLRFAYRPWLLPGFRECELLTSTPSSAAAGGQSLRELRLAFDSPDFGRGELRLLFKPPRAGYRIHLASPKHARVLSTALQVCAQTLARDVPAEFLGVCRLNGSFGLSALLGDTAQATYGRRI